MTFYIVGLDRSFPVLTDHVQGGRLLAEIETSTGVSCWVFSDDWTIQGGTQYTVKDVKVLTW